MKESDILADFDGLAAEYHFPGFNNMSYDSIDARMHLYRADGKWALLVEEAVDWIGSGGPQTILFGTGPLMRDGDTGLIDPFESLVAVTVDDDDELVTVTLRGNSVDRAAILARAAELGLEVPLALLVLASETRREDLFYSATELERHLAPGAKHVLTIEEWSHPDVYRGPKPSESEVFQQVARVLATGDTTAYAPTEVPNSRNWREWLDSK